MTHRERFRQVAAREKADRAVYDLSGCPQTLIDYPQTREALKIHLGFEGDDNSGFPLDERILTFFDIDTRIVGGMPAPQTVHNRTEGYILSPAHCIQHDVPVENIAAIYSGARKFYGKRQNLHRH